MTSMTIGPAMEIGGNTVEMTAKGKVQITNPQGKIKTLSQDEFQKNVLRNAEKIQNGEDFEFKKDHKGLKLAAAAVGTAAVTTAVIYRKQIGKYLQNFSFKKVWKDIKNFFGNLFGKNKKVQHNIYTKEPGLSVGTKKAINEGIVENTHKMVKEFEESLARTKGAAHNKKQKMYNRLFE